MVRAQGGLPMNAFERLGANPAFQEMFRCGHRRHVPKGQVVLTEGDEPRSLYFVDLTRRHQNLWLALAGPLAARLRSLNQRMAELPRLQARDRVWLVVAELAEHAAEDGNADGIRLRIRREDLGRLAACSRDAAGNRPEAP